VATDRLPIIDVVVERVSDDHAPRDIVAAIDLILRAAVTPAGSDATDSGAASGSEPRARDAANSGARAHA